MLGSLGFRVLRFWWLLLFSCSSSWVIIYLWDHASPELVISLWILFTTPVRTSQWKESQIKYVCLSICADSICSFECEVRHVANDERKPQHMSSILHLRQSLEPKENTTLPKAPSCVTAAASCFKAAAFPLLSQHWHLCSWALRQQDFCRLTWHVWGNTF